MGNKGVEKIKVVCEHVVFPSRSQVNHTPTTRVSKVWCRSDTTVVRAERGSPRNSVTSQCGHQPLTATRNALRLLCHERFVAALLSRIMAVSMRGAAGPCCPPTQQSVDVTDVALLHKRIYIKKSFQ
jgi:hypothetical protein